MTGVQTCALPICFPVTIRFCVSVEGEIGVLGNLETGEAGEEDGVGAVGKLSHDQMLTSVEDARRFVQDTGVDALAIAIGTSHGAYKFTRPPTGDVLRIDRIKEIHEALPNTHIVMHGSSSVPQEWLKIINENGGAIGETYGVPVAEIVEGIKHGVRKVNIDTDLRLASTGAIRQFMTEHPAETFFRFMQMSGLPCRAKLTDTRDDLYKATTGRYNTTHFSPLRLYAFFRLYHDSLS